MFFQGMCMELVCPPMSIPYNGKCLPVVSGMSTFSVRVYFTVQIPPNVIMSFHTINNAILIRLTKQFAKWKLECTVCQAEFNTDDASPASYYFIVNVVSSDKCQFQALSSMLHSSSSLSAKTSHHILSFSVVLSNFPPSTTRLSIIHTAARYQCPEPEMFDRMLLGVNICPKILIPKGELENISPNSSIQMLTDSLRMHSLSNNSELITICVDKYNELAQSLAQQSGSVMWLTSPCFVLCVGTFVSTLLVVI